MSDRMSRASNWTDTSSCFPMAPISCEVIFLHTLTVRVKPGNPHKDKITQRERKEETHVKCYSKWNTHDTVATQSWWEMLSVVTFKCSRKYCYSEFSALKWIVWGFLKNKLSTVSVLWSVWRSSRSTAGGSYSMYCCGRAQQQNIF